MQEEKAASPEAHSKMLEINLLLDVSFFSLSVDNTSSPRTG